MLAAFFLETPEPPASLSLATMSNSNSSSHAQWQGTTRWKQGWNKAWKGWEDSTTTESAASELIPDERVMNALHKMQDYLQQAMVISQRRSQKTCTEQATSRTNGHAAFSEAMEAATQARDRQEEGRLFYEQKHVKRAQKPRRSSTAPSKTLSQKPKRSRNM